MAKIGIQLYTVRDKLAKDYLGTIRKMKALGYEGVEFPAGAIEAATAEEIHTVLKETELELAGFTFEHRDFETRIEEIIAYTLACGAKTIVYPWLPEEKRQSADDYVRFAQQLSQWGKQLRENGISLLYHIHGYEFEAFDGKTGFDLFFEALDLDAVKLEIDVYWVESGGVDCITFMERYGKYSPSIHFKDYLKRDGKLVDTEIGDGAIDMVKVAEIGLREEADWFIVEQEEFDKPTLESAGISANNLFHIREQAMK